MHVIALTTHCHNEQNTDVVTEYYAAYSYEQAAKHKRDNLERAGWTVDKQYGWDVTVWDIRDKCDHITD